METYRMRLRRDPRAQRHQNGQSHARGNEPLQDEKPKSPVNERTKKMSFGTARPCTRWLLIILFVLVAIPIRVKLFGHNGSIHGGLLGTLIDSTIRTYTFRKTLKKRDDELAALGYHLPPLTQENVNKRGLPVLTQSYLAESLLRSAERKKRRGKAEKSETASCKAVPRQILQPNIGDWYRPFRVTGEFELLEFQESEMRAFMKSRFPGLPNNDIHIWGLCSLYWFGGYFVSSEIRSSNVLIESTTAKGARCKDFAAFFFRGDALAWMKATPRHPSILCAIQKLADSGKPFPSIDALLFGNHTTSAPSSRWFESDCSGNLPCCSYRAVDSQSGTIFLERTEPNPPTIQTGARSDAAVSKIVFNVQEREGTAAPTKRPKRSIGARLAAQSCQAGWLCNRCLKASWFGSFQACSSVCRSCYVNTICKDPDDPVRKVVQIDVVASESQHALSPSRPTNRIPRIIHQTWFEDITVDSYPHLVRIQNSWKRSSWEYRFYNDDSARAYIHGHFPPRFLEAFDALIPGAFKADFFRLLLLLREGGIYVDADVKLDVDLDVFVTRNLGFFAPRDFIAGYDDGCYCIWNGMIGAEPGHPFIARAVERMLNVVLNRGDYYDIEREVCRASPEVGSTEVWKLRALDILTLTGPCALGISVNGALGRQNLADTFDIGWFQVDDMDENPGNRGDVLFLLPDKYDMGEFRFTDIDRNLLVASTEHNMLVKKPLLVSQMGTPQKAHYSSQEHISDIYGETGVYIDNSVTDEVYEIHLHRN